MAPLIRLCMNVVQADGVVKREKIRHVRAYFDQVFEFGSSDLNSLTSLMKEGPQANLEPLLQGTSRRLPNLEPVDLLAVLADVSKCDGEVHPAEVELIRRVAMMMGLEQHNWAELAEHLGLNESARGSQANTADGSMSRPAAYRVLGLEKGASRAEIQSAYRKLVTDYHQDRVASLS
ncbi:MAG: TerB family tellurite resistance protein [Armatimonadota bacterium]